MLEKHVERRVCNYAKNKFDFIAYKFTSPARRSVPDRLFVGPMGVTFFIEFKAPGKKATPNQRREITRLIERGARVWVVDDPHVGIQLIDYVVNMPYMLPESSCDTLKVGAF